MEEELTPRRIMAEFARRTGLSEPDKAEQRRYLWTDAFAVCNYLTLYVQSGEYEYRDMAVGLVDQVHGVLGRHRPDDPRRGWLSGLDEEQGKLHPTKAGLRIGKKLNERLPSDAHDERLEWNRDGQYFRGYTMELVTDNTRQTFKGMAYRTGPSQWQTTAIFMPRI